MKRKTYMKTPKLFTLIFGITLISLHGLAAPPQLSVTASKNTGRQGDEIVFSWDVESNGNKIKLVRVRMDGAIEKWESPHTWTALPGTHVLYIEVRWDAPNREQPASPADKKGKPEGPPMLNAYQLVEIQGTKADFTHPGLYSSRLELNAMHRYANQEQAHPIKSAIPSFLECGSGSRATSQVPYTSLDWKPHPVKIVYPKTDDKARLFDDGRAVYAHALLWAITHKQAHADKAIEILNAWGSTFEDIQTKNGDIYKSLFGSWTANHWVAGAEIIRTYKNQGQHAGWKPEDVARFMKMCRVFERLMLEWQGGANVNGLQNQRLAVARTRLALGVFMDDQDLFDMGTKILFDDLNSQKKTIERHGHPVNLVALTIAADGEIMEFNRDGPHGRGSLNALVTAAEILRHQQVPEKYDLYNLKFDDDKMPRLLIGSEYAAKSHLHGPVDLTWVKNFKNTGPGSHTEMVVNYYKYILQDRYKLPFTEEVNLKSRPQGGTTYIIPWTTLTHGFDVYRRK
ncbi:MAG: alginate lyase family protein [Pontiella sp.]